MRITFLGTGGGFGIPNPFCRCENCRAAREAGGKSLRASPAVLVNDDLLIDCGRDLYGAVRRLNLRLDGLRTLVITHIHQDHFDPFFFWGRSYQARDTELPPLTVYAPQEVLDAITAFYQQYHSWDRPTVGNKLRLVLQPVRAGMMKIARRYRLYFFAATHGEARAEECLLVGVKDGRSGYFHGYDSGPYSEETWALLAKHQFDAAALDACIGKQADYASSEHMTFHQTVAHAKRLRKAGILKPEGTALATHFVHQSAGRHDDLVADYKPHNVVPAYDGLILNLET